LDKEGQNTRGILGRDHFYFILSGTRHFCQSSSRYYELNVVSTTVGDYLGHCGGRRGVKESRLDHAALLNTGTDCSDLKYNIFNACGTIVAIKTLVLEFDFMVRYRQKFEIPPGRDLDRRHNSSLLTHQAFKQNRFGIWARSSKKAQVRSKRGRE
jgi:hypothetical protein